MVVTERQVLDEDVLEAWRVGGRGSERRPLEERKGADVRCRQLGADEEWPVGQEPVEDRARAGKPVCQPAGAVRIRRARRLVGFHCVGRDFPHTIEPGDEDVDPCPGARLERVEPRLEDHRLEPLDDAHGVEDDLATVEFGHRHEVLTRDGAHGRAVTGIVVDPLDFEALARSSQGDPLDVGGMGDAVDSEHAAMYFSQRRSSPLRSLAAAISHACSSGPFDYAGATILFKAMPKRHFVKYTFLKVDPAWRRLEDEERAEHKREFLAACENFGQDRLLRAFSTVGTRGDTDMMLLSQATNLERIHEFHVVLAQSGLMKWADTPYSFLALTKPSEYSDESRLEVRPAHSKYLFVYPFVKTREWYRMAPDERYKVMQEHIAIGREYPQIDLNTSYSFGLDDQEFVVAFETDEPADFLDLVQRLRTTEASAYTKRDTPTFTCVSTSVERALNALDGVPLTDALPVSL